eukprot:CAMPEP_0183313810 /NCGR_PEP_ID=MMETSP0160_2-20130417/46519_1 /TAXON_ID=2839 ORGANISM="Odontella Sinensis, Strain Grunow 1884" /NCGR_SAMPLE_ID=MMETSP0160_2 /ASSEMBLY_ACC=CAM_ASM_000250 /LENGTH=31 /DNA_ID= /DNA_START= /DNA_END= /DNA_ORIENTATION=
MARIRFAALLTLAVLSLASASDRKEAAASAA